MAAVPNVQLQQPVVAAAPVVAAEPARASSLLSIKVWKAVSMIFEILANVGAVIVAAAVITANISAWHILTALALSFAAKKANVTRERMHDFDNPEELQRLRATAPHMSFTELKQSFRLLDIKQYNLVPIEGENGLRHKVLLYLSTPANFSYMRSAFGGGDVEKLLEHGIIDTDIASAIRGDNQGRIQLILDEYRPAAM
jgi:hypothetical protein